MPLNIKINDRQVKDVSRRMKILGKKVSGRSIINAVLLKIKSNILLRTNSGIDVNGRRFKGYSTAYKLLEGKTLVNLTRTGTMLNAMTQKAISDDKGKIFFQNVGYSNSSMTARRLAEIHNEGDGVPKREFFGVGKGDNKDAVKIYQKAIKKARRSEQL